MRVTLKRTVICLVLACTLSVSWAQQATVNHSVVLHRDPNAKSKSLEHLIEGDRVTLVDTAPDSGFCHVKTEDDQVGWIPSKYVTTASKTPTLPTPGPSQPADAQCDPNLWIHVYHAQRLVVKQQ
jgi:uncharacterized protein YgiM (DUF1202 family)